MARSPLTEKIDRVKGMVVYVRENLSLDEYDLFLDMVAPEPQIEHEPEKPAANSQPVKKRKIQKCDSCNWTKRAAVHKDPATDGYHEFQPSKSTTKKSARASSIQTDTSDLCGFEVDGKVCKGTANDGIHDPTMGYGNYHEFKTAA